MARRIHPAVHGRVDGFGAGIDVFGCAAVLDAELIEHGKARRPVGAGVRVIFRRFLRAFLRGFTQRFIEDEGRGVVLDDRTRLDADAVIVASGFDLFPAEMKEEYGYGLYDRALGATYINGLFEACEKAKNA